MRQGEAEEVVSTWRDRFNIKLVHRDASDLFLRHAADLIEAKGGIIDHVDCTVICEAPKVGPHRAAMVERIAAILGIAPARVSVKATTTERLGFTGRGEGIAAQAAATVSLPAGAR